MAMEPTRKKRAVCGMFFIRPPYSSMFRVCVADNGAGPHKEQGLEYGMVERMEKRRGEAEDGQRLHVERPEYQRAAETEEYDPDVFDAVIGEESFDIVFGEGVENTQERGSSAPGQDNGSPPQRCDRHYV